MIVTYFFFSSFLTFQSEVRQLEGSIEPTGEASFSPYLIPDTGVLTSHLGLMIISIINVIVTYIFFSSFVSFQSEVWQLEGSIEPTGEASFSPYLIPDTGVLTSHLGLIRQLAGSTRFIIIIPQTGLFLILFVSLFSVQLQD